MFLFQSLMLSRISRSPKFFNLPWTCLDVESLTLLFIVEKSCPWSKLSVFKQIIRARVTCQSRERVLKWSTCTFLMIRCICTWFCLNQGRNSWVKNPRGQGPVLFFCEHLRVSFVDPTLQISMPYLTNPRCMFPRNPAGTV